MNFTTEMYNLLIRFTADSEGKGITVAELQNLPYWRCVWGSWKAKAFYKLDGYYEKLEDVPEGSTSYTIVDKEVTQYWQDQTGWHQQTMTKEFCKSVYGVNKDEAENNTRTIK